GVADRELGGVEGGQVDAVGHDPDPVPLDAVDLLDVEGGGAGRADDAGRLGGGDVGAPLVQGPGPAGIAVGEADGGEVVDGDDQRRPAGGRDGRAGGVDDVEVADDRLRRRAAVGHPGVVEAVAAEREGHPVDGQGADLRRGLVVVGVEQDEVVAVADLHQPLAQRQGVDADPGGDALEERFAVEPAPQGEAPAPVAAGAGAGSASRSASASRQWRNGAIPAAAQAAPDRTLLAGRGAGRASSAVVVVPTTAGSSPASSTAAQARSCQVQAPWLVTWNRPWRRSTARRARAPARSGAYVGQPRWSSTTRRAPPSRARPTMVSTKFRPRRPKTHDVRATAHEPAWRATSRSPPSLERP